MKKVLYIYELKDMVNGHAIFDGRLTKALANAIPGDDFKAISLDTQKGVFGENIKLKDIDLAGNVAVFSQFNTFKIATKFKKSEIVFIHHDLPYNAYFLSGGILNFAKGLYVLSYLKYYWKFSDRDLYISAIERKSVSSNNKHTAHIKVGTKPGIGMPEFTAIAPVAIFTGNYKWSLKIRSLYHSFRNGYSGSLKLVAVNTDEVFYKCAKQFNIHVTKEDDYPEPSKIKLGIITDNFISGFKLKALELISTGCCIASFADISEEFEGAPYANLFIKKIDNLNDIDAYYNSLLAEEDIFKKYNSFYRYILSVFNWDVTANQMKEILT